MFKRFFQKLKTFLLPSPPGPLPVPSVEIVRLARAAFAGGSSSDDCRNFLVWSEADQLKATFISELPEKIFYDSEDFVLQQPYCGDWDALLNHHRQLVGFSLSYCDESVLASGFVKQHPQLMLDGPMLQIVLESSLDYTIECVQGIGTRLYRNAAGNYMFLFPEWFGWGSLPFPLETENVPCPAA